MVLSNEMLLKYMAEECNMPLEDVLDNIEHMNNNFWQG